MKMGSATGVGTAFGVLTSMVALLTARPAIAEPPAATPPSPPAAFDWFDYEPSR